MPKTTLLIDADIVAYRAAAAANETAEWSPDIISMWADCNIIRRLCDDVVDSVYVKLEANEVIVAFSDAENFRQRLYPRYKGHRPMVRPVGLATAKDYLASKYDSHRIPGVEADDVLGILSTAPERQGYGRQIIVTLDKDLKTIPGATLCDLQGERLEEITPHQADWFWMHQVVTGDRADGYPGLPGAGEKRADFLLRGTSLAEWWPAVVAAYEKAGLTEDDALLQARLARILRAEDYVDQKIDLWSPERIGRAAPQGVRASRARWMRARAKTTRRR